jgi:hypothetical protein
MLDRNDAQPLAIEAIAALPCEVQLPAGWGAGAAEKGLFASGPDERRGFLRRGLQICAALEYRQTFPSLGRARAWHRVYVVNVSRSGLLLLHSEQLFPKERLVVVLPDGKDVLVEISRCRRIQERCFEVGGRFVVDRAVVGILGGEKPATLECG